MCQYCTQEVAKAIASLENELHVWLETGEWMIDPEHFSNVLGVLRSCLRCTSSGACGAPHHFSLSRLLTETSKN